MPGRQMCTEISQISQRPMAFNGDIMGWLVDSILAFMTFHILGIIIPTDELIFFRGVG